MKLPASSDWPAAPSGATCVLRSFRSKDRGHVPASCTRMSRICASNEMPASRMRPCIVHTHSSGEGVQLCLEDRDRDARCPDPGCQTVRPEAGWMKPTRQRQRKRYGASACRRLLSPSSATEPARRSSSPHHTSRLTHCGPRYIHPRSPNVLGTFARVRTPAEKRI